MPEDSTINQIRKVAGYAFAYHITRIENLYGIFEQRFLRARSRLDITTINDISNQQIQRNRELKIIPQTNLSLHDYVPFFLTYKAPMVAQIQNQNEDLVYLQISLDIFERIPGCIISDGNAASSDTKFENFTHPDILKILDFSVLHKMGFAGCPQKTRKKGAELLVPKAVPIQEIRSLIFYSESGKDKGLEIFNKLGIDSAKYKVLVWPQVFYSSNPIGAK